MSKKILFISQYFPPDVTAAAFRASETAELMAEEDFEVTVLTASPHRSQVESEKSVTEKTTNYKVLRAPIYKGREKFGKFGYLLHYLSFLLTSFFWGLLKGFFSFDYVIVTSPPLPLGLSGWLISRVKRAKFILDVRDLWPDSVVSTGNIRENGVFHKWGKKLEYFLYGRADVLTCVSKPMKEEILRTGKIEESNVQVIYNGLYEPDLRGEMDVSFQASINTDKLTVTYLGNMGNSQNLVMVLEAAKLISHLNEPELEFLLVGGGVRKQSLQEEARRRGVTNVRFAGPVDKSQVFGIMKSSSALLIHLKKSDAFAKTIPSKVFDYLYSNKPILYGIEGEGKKILDSLPGNLYFQQENPEALAEAVEKLARNYEDYSSQAQHNREFVIKNYSRKSMTDKLISVLDGLE